MPRMLLLIFLTLGQPGFVLAQDTNASQTTPSSQSVIKQLSALAKQGNAEAHYHLGMFYNNGVGVARSPTRALSYIRRSAEGGDPLGKYKLGCYLIGQFGTLEGLTLDTQ